MTMPDDLAALENVIGNRGYAGTIRLLIEVLEARGISRFILSRLKAAADALAP